MMRIAMFFLCLLLLLHAHAWTSDAASEPTAKSEPSQGLTLEEIGRGLKSAAKNIEEEIPKIGPAIGRTFKKVTSGGKDTDKSKAPPQNSTKPKQ